MNILLVDDDISSVTVLTTLLEFDHTLQVATNGREAYQAVKKNRYDVVVTDIRMPKMTGIELLKAIRIDDQQLPVIIVTGHPGRENLAEAERFGVTAYFTKPLDVAGFMGTLSRLEERGRKTSSTDNG